MQSFGIHYNDVVQLDELIEHAQFHNEAYGDNLFVFISKHYGELKSEHEKNHQEEKGEHEKLPFSHLCHIGSVSVFFLDTCSIEIEALEISEFRTSNFYYQPCTSSLHTNGILQPPRIS